MNEKYVYLQPLLNISILTIELNRLSPKDYNGFTTRQISKIRSSSTI